MGITKIKFDDPWVLLDSGTFIHYDNEKPLTLTIIESDGTPISVRFTFQKDSENKQPLIKFGSFDKDTILVTITHNGHLSNFGFLKPVKFGSFNGKELFFNFRLDLNNADDSILINFSWFTGKEEKI